jgi:GINS complex subunit 2
MSGLSCTFTNTEMEYIALDADVEIIPRLAVEVVPCVTQTYGPFRPNVPVLVPLWLALILSQRGECTVKLGERFCSDYISSIRKQERDDVSSFQSVPSLYLEKARLLSKDVKLDMVEQSLLNSSMVRQMSRCRSIIIFFVGRLTIPSSKQNSSGLS